MNLRPGVLFCLLTAICISGVFSSTLFQAAPLSRFNLICNLDMLANPGLQGAAITVNQDPSACLQSIPREMFVQNSLVKGDPAVWNPLNGCGQPVLADPSNTLWSPLDLIFAPQHWQFYNIGLVLKIILGAVFAYIYYFRAGCSPWAACTAALGFALCPRVLKGIELATNFEFVPAVFLLFQFLKKQADWQSISLLGAGLALSYTMLHPEVYFVAVSSAALLWLFERTQPAERDKIGWKRRIFTLACLAAFTFVLVAPLLLPFLEYLRYARSYKYDGASVEYIPLGSLFAYLDVPKLSGNLFTGWILLMGLPCGFVRGIKIRLFSLILIGGWSLFSFRPGPLASYLSEGQFSYLLPEYALGTIIFLLCLFAADGLTSLSKAKVMTPLSVRLVHLLLGFVLVLAPLICFSRGILPPGMQFAVSGKVVLAALSTLLLSSILLFALAFLEEREEAAPKQLPLIAGLLAMLALPLINLGTLIAPARAELPVTAEVELPPPGRVEFIRKIQDYEADYRIAACGRGLLPPNTNLLYNLRDLRTCSPLNDTSYLAFMNQLGARLGYCNMIEIPGKLSHLIDLASVRLLASSSPLRSTAFVYGRGGSCPAATSAASAPSSISGRIMPGMRLMSSRCTYLAASAEIEAEVVMKVHDNLAGRYQSQLVLRDEHNRDIWKGEVRGLSTLRELRGSSHQLVLNWLVPAPNSNVSVRLFLLLFDTWTGQLLKADGISFNKQSDLPAILLAKLALRAQKAVQSLDGRFSLVYETADLIRIYRNNRACPRAYLVHKVIEVGSHNEALGRISDPGFDPHSEAVLERETQDFPGLDSGGTRNACQKGTESVQIVCEKNLELRLNCKTSRPALLLLTDLYYPGWTAFVDNLPAKIYRTNYLFRGVLVEPGNHLIVFRYEPLPLKLAAIGSILAILGVFLSVLSFAQKHLFRH